MTRRLNKEGKARLSIQEARKRIERVMEVKIPRKIGEEFFPWQYLGSREENGCFEFVYRIPAGYSHLEAKRQIDAFYAACGAPIELEDYAGAVLLRVVWKDFPALIPYEETLLEQAPGKKEIILGLSRQGSPLVHSLRVPHLLIAGKSGYGKTDLIRWILFQLIAKNSPDEVEIWIVDLKGFSFLPFKEIPHISRIARDLPGAATLLQAAVKRMEERSREVWESGDRSKAASYKPLFVLIDEAYMISPRTVTAKESKALAKICDESAAKISGTGREAGIGLFYCTQRPDADVINPLVKANMDCKICFKTETESNSLVVLDLPGAEKLPHGKPGRILYSRDGLEEAQVPYIGGDEEWTELLKPYRRDADRIGRMKSKEVFEDESKRENLDTGEGGPLLFDSPGGPVFSKEWLPVKEGKRNPKEIRKGRDD